VSRRPSGCNCCQNPVGDYYEPAGQAKASLEYLVRTTHQGVSTPRSVALVAACPAHADPFKPRRSACTLRSSRTPVPPSTPSYRCGGTGSDGAADPASHASI